MELLNELAVKGIKGALIDSGGMIVSSTLPLQKNDGLLLLSAAKVADILSKRTGKWREIELYTRNGYGMIFKGAYILLLWAKDNSYKPLMRQYAEKILRV